MGLKLGTDCYAAKPFGFYELVVKLGILVDRATQNRPLPTHLIPDTHIFKNRVIVIGLTEQKFTFLEPFVQKIRHL
ncbi:MAG: hypothetical protein ABJL72_10720 [Roseobacter sp.]